MPMSHEPRGPLIVGRELDRLPSCGSTNDVARAAAANGAPDGYSVLADAQTSGRGQRGRTWLAEPGAGVLLSVVLRPQLAAGESSVLMMLAACAGAAAIGSFGLTPDVKWPNDLLLGGRKVGGILLETSFVGDELEFAIVGIGLNVNVDVARYSEIAATATSLSAEAGTPIDREAVAVALLRELDDRYRLIRGGRAEVVQSEWRRRLATLGRRVVLLDERGTGETVFAEDVEPDGALIVRRDDGSRRVVRFGEVSLREPV
jgi:BirA family transcriptional regulator, biotin operon repressor / biotin---[acetyl-CoA-carboxylase] ligase